ncbi:hypothetical protein [Bradyrhizobium sp. AUGA SZCCT0283]|uniref:hypothetical protein n=1 Tax=Bradyrhizobium sp. AUGA SZCCT0283 TaxID=2807671 RepID=UPI001BAE2533|nr:hypothetical protein [Bradyrhizobium sp. AUGA SZCCT0283]MBR1277262.1 hypothetical protein [Bradyrhizobium sp. AUGA SZCCT0283]
MRHLIKGLIAAVAVMAAAPAMACGYTPCAQPVYVAPVAAYAGCNPCGGWVRERLPDPEQQYYYVNQGPTYTGPGNLAPYPVYREGSISGYGYGYNRPYHHRAHRYYHRHHHGYAARFYHGQRVLRRYY